MDRAHKAASRHGQRTASWEGPTHPHPDTAGVLCRFRHPCSCLYNHQYSAQGIGVKGVRSGLGSFLVSCCGLSLKDPTRVSVNRVGTALCRVCCQGSREPGGEDLQGPRRDAALGLEACWFLRWRRTDDEDRHWPNPRGVPVFCRGWGRTEHTAVRRVGVSRQDTRWTGAG
ncbi:hypothetical protein B0H14DRAFT_2575280 [Mycena olivaceomarginata]|nr:hypothetical protein B0H14DRAFT_2575280 [Mycena olivaceomarginata]